MSNDKLSEKEDLVKRYGELATRLTNYKNDPKRNNQNYLWDGFGLIHNRILSLTEILSDYYRKWDEFLEKNPSIDDETKIKKFLDELLLLLLGVLFPYFLV